MTYLMAIDPGQATGWSYWWSSPSEPLLRLEFGLIQGGCEGFMTWTLDVGWATIADVVIEDWRLGGDVVDPDTEPLEIIGALRMLRFSGGQSAPVRQPRWMKPQVTDEKLKEHGLWVTGSQVDWTDGRDVNDSAIHAITWAKHQEHLPTLEKFFPAW